MWPWGKFWLFVGNTYFQRSRVACLLGFRWPWARMLVVSEELSQVPSFQLVCFQILFLHPYLLIRFPLQSAAFRKSCLSAVSTGPLPSWLSCWTNTFPHCCKFWIKKNRSEMLISSGCSKRSEHTTLQCSRRSLWIRAVPDAHRGHIWASCRGALKENPDKCCPDLNPEAWGTVY